MDKRPNILLITVDQMRGDCLGVAGHPVVETPVLDGMCQGGVRFSRAYSATPTCIAARAALLTGLSQRTHGRVGYQDRVPWRYDHYIADGFADAGYHTQCVGKMHVFPNRALCGFHNIVLHDGYFHHSRASQRGAGESYAAVDDYLLWLKREIGVDADLIDSGLGCNSWMARPFPYEERLHPTNWVVSESIDFLRRRDPDKPFFLYTSFVRPHSPLDPPAYYYDMYKDADIDEPFLGDWAETADEGREGLRIDASRGIVDRRAVRRARAAYYGLITHIDHQIGRLMEALFEQEGGRNTVVLFASDHGDLLGDHNLLRKTLPYEGSAAVPFIVYDPSDIIGARRNRDADALVELRDVLPTLYDIAGIDIPPHIEGRSLVPVLRGEADGVRDHLHGEHEAGIHSTHYVVSGRDKYIWYSQTGREQLFDLSRDPHELHDLAGDPDARGRVARLRDVLVRELEGREEGYVRDGALVVGRRPRAVLSCVEG